MVGVLDDRALTAGESMARDDRPARQVADEQVAIPLDDTDPGAWIGQGDRVLVGLPGDQSGLVGQARQQADGPTRANPVG